MGCLKLAISPEPILKIVHRAEQPGVVAGVGAGILLGQLSAGITSAGISGLLSSASDFVAGFVGGFAGGFVSGVLGAAISGASLEDALLSGVITGAIAGTLAGLANKRPGAKVEAAEQGSDMGDKNAQLERIKEVTPDAKLETISSEDLTAKVYEKYGNKEFTLGNLERDLKVDGFNLNPDGYVLSNQNLRNNIRSLYSGLADKYGAGNFEFKITGGDRYIENGKVYSSTNNKLVPKSEITSRHIQSNGAKAVDLRINGVSEKTFYKALDNISGFDDLGIFNGITRYTRRNLYPIDRHTHIFIK